MPRHNTATASGRKGKGKGKAPREPRGTAGRPPVVMFEFAQNDPKMDTGMRLCRRGLAQSLRPPMAGYKGIVLSGEATAVLSPADAELIHQYGIAGVNCSWNRLDEVRLCGKAQNQRLLPLFIAANTINYGKPNKLCTAEALAAGLWVVGLEDYARELLEETFSWGPEFFRLNEDLVERYRACANEAEIKAAINAYAEECKAEKEARGSGWDDMLPPSESEYDEQEESELEEAGDAPQQLDEPARKSEDGQEHPKE